MSWWHDPFALFQTNIRRIDAGLDTEAAATFIAELGYDAWLLNAGGIFSFYPVAGEDQETSSTLGDRPSGDLIGDALASCRKRSLRLIARFDFSRVPEARLGAWKDSVHRSKSGGLTVEDGLINMCPRSDYYRVRGREVVREFVARYDVDGVFFNWMQFPIVTYRRALPGACHCQRCLSAWSEAFPDRAYPAAVEDEGFSDLFAMNMRYLQGLAESFATDVKQIRPNAALFLADARVDMVFLEINSFLGAVDWWEHTPSEMASVHRTAHPDVPALVHAANNVGLPFRLVPEEPAQFARYAVQGIARGARPATVIIGPPTREHFTSWKSVPPVLEPYRRHRDIYRTLEPAAPVAILRPEGGGVASLAALGDADEVAEYRGLFAALQRRHVPFDVLGAEYANDLVDDGVFARYSVVVIPAGLQVSEKVKVELVRCIRAGACVLSTGDPRRLDDVLGRTTTVDEILAGLPGLGGRFGYRRDGRFGDRIPVLGTFWGVEGLDAQEADWALSTQAPPGPPEITHGNEDPAPYSFILRESIGDGTLLRVPWTIGATHQESGLSSIADFLRSLIEEVEGTPHSVRFDGPECIEFILGRSGSRHVVHLVNHSGGRPDRLSDPIPVHVRLGVSGAERAIRSLRADSEVGAMTPADGDGIYWAEFIVDDFEVLVVE